MTAILALVVRALYYLILARVISSWVVMAVPKLRHNPIVELLHSLTEPMLAPIRRLIPPMSGLDLSPLILWFLLTAILRIL